MGLSFALAGVAGLMLALRTTFTPFSGVERLLISFEVVVMGGLGSFWGAMLAGIALGVAQLVGLRLNPNSGFLYANLVFFAFVMRGRTACSERGSEASVGAHRNARRLYRARRRGSLAGR